VRDVRYFESDDLADQRRPAGVVGGRGFHARRAIHQFRADALQRAKYMRVMAEEDAVFERAIIDLAGRKPSIDFAQHRLDAASISIRLPNEQPVTVRALRSLGRTCACLRLNQVTSMRESIRRTSLSPVRAIETSSSRLMMASASDTPAPPSAANPYR